MKKLFSLSLTRSSIPFKHKGVNTGIYFRHVPQERIKRQHECVEK